MSKVIVSNRYERLVKRLKEELTQFRAPFQRKIIALPSHIAKNDLMIALLNSGLEVITGIEFIELNSLIPMLCDKSLKFPSPTLLSLFLEQELPQTDPKHRQQVADSLADVFLKMGKYGGDFLPSWLQKSGWQQSLWKKIFSHWNSLHEITAGRDRPEIHLFNIPFIPESYFQFLQTFNPTTYALSPCLHFWGDLVTPREKKKLLGLDDGFAPFLEDQHPLLASLGRLARHHPPLWQDELEEDYVEEDLTPLQYDLLHHEISNEGPITFHLATSRLREVEILLTQILPLLTDIDPSDVLVLAPDISKYETLIEHIFSPHCSFQITHTEKESKLPDLLTLDEKRWSVDAVLALYPNKEVRKWLGGVKWGFNRAHREELLGGEMNDEGTWETCLDELMIKLAKSSEIDLNEGEVLAHFYEFVHELKQDLSDGPMTTLEWSKKMQHLAWKYCREEVQPLGEVPGHVFTFDQVKRHFLRGANRKSGVRHPTQVGGVRFASLKEGAIRPAKALFVIGMTEGEFPRPSLFSSLDEMKGQGHYVPTSNDEDRAAFLEALLSVRGRLDISYVEAPSLVVQELQDYLADPQIFAHPPFAFHKSYFETGSQSLPHFYDMAKMHYQTLGRRPLIPKYEISQEVIDSQEVKVSSVIGLAKNPFRFFCLEALGLRLDLPVNPGNEFVLSNIDRALLNKGMMSEEVLPIGPFREIALKRLEEIPKGIELSPFVKEVVEKEDRVIHPALCVTVDGAEVTLVGLFDPPELEKVNVKSVAKSWPALLICSMLGLGEKIDGDENHLAEYLRYYFRARKSPSPLYPDWAESLLVKGEKDFEKALKTTLKSTQFVDDYLEFVMHTSKNVEEMYRNWSPYLKTLMEPAVQFANV